MLKKLLISNICYTFKHFPNGSSSRLLCCCGRGQGGEEKKKNISDEIGRGVEEAREKGKKEEIKKYRKEKD